MSETSKRAAGTAEVPSTRPAVKPWPYQANRPQRYTINYARYLSLGGPSSLEKLVEGFVAGGVNHGDMARFYFFCLVFDQLAKERLAGDIVELGTYKGNTATFLAEIARKLGKTAYVLDTFEGFSRGDLKGIDSAAKAGVFGDTSLEAVRALVGDDNVRFIKGYFPDTADQLPADGQYCLVHIDCDLYAPIISALKYFYPRMVPGGFLIVHDYSSLYWNGAEKAVDEFFADKPEAALPLPDSAGSVVIRKVRPPGDAHNWLVQKRAALLGEQWTSAANGGLSEVLGFGWSGPESWGVWGVGESHDLHLALPPPSGGAIELQADVHAVLAGKRTRQTVDVVMAGEKICEWIFEVGAKNRGVRTAKILVPPGKVAAGGLLQLTLSLRPTSVAAPAELDPALSEKRPLGVALHRLRVLFQRASGS